MPRVQLQRRRRHDDLLDIANKVCFKHPGYPDGKNILLILPGVDNGRIHHQTALTACAILANCRWDGFFSETRNGEAVKLGDDDVLPWFQYYFRVPGDQEYPVVPSFDTFSCPSILPKEWYEDETWIEVSPIRQVDRRDQTCRVTGDLLPNVAAYVIPRVHKEWWKRNGMFAHAENPGSAQGPHCNDNAILLRRDVRRLWDDNHIAIVPKAGKWVVHVLNMDQTDAFVGFYQNLELQTLYNIPSQYLLYRFALAILSKSVFFDQGVPRKSVTADTKDPSHLYLYPSESEQPV